MFTKEIERELLAGRVDLAVHSLKDLPTEVAAGLCLAAVPQRAAVADALLSDKYPSLDQLPPGATVGTGSLRRRAQLLHVRPDLQIRDIRGNVDTRLRKLHGGQFDAIVLAEAGLERLGLAGQITQRLPPAIMLPAVGQGALALEVRSDDRRTRQLVQSLDHAASHAAVAAERAMLAALRGGCLAPVAAWGRLDQDRPGSSHLDRPGAQCRRRADDRGHPSAAAGRGRATGPSRGRRSAGPRGGRPDRVGTAIAALTSTSDTAGVPRLPRGSEVRYTTFSGGGLCPPDGCVAPSTNDLLLKGDPAMKRSILVAGLLLLAACPLRGAQPTGPVGPMPQLGLATIGDQGNIEVAYIIVVEVWETATRHEAYTAADANGAPVQRVREVTATSRPSCP